MTGVEVHPDTHVLLWFLQNSSRVSASADAVLLNPQADLVLPATAYAEACWIVEQGKTQILDVPAFVAALDAALRFTIWPLDREIIDLSSSLTIIREMHDRQIVATALYLQNQGEQVALLTKDANITQSGYVPVIW